MPATSLNVTLFLSMVSKRALLRPKFIAPRPADFICWRKRKINTATIRMIGIRLIIMLPKVLLTLVRLAPAARSSARSSFCMRVSTFTSKRMSSVALTDLPSVAGCSGKIGNHSRTPSRTAEPSLAMTTCRGFCKSLMITSLEARALRND